MGARKGAGAGLLLLVVAAAVSATAAPSVPPERYEGFAVGNRVDDLVLATLKAAGTPPSGLCADDVFLRRVYLDTIGTLPTPREVRGFLADSRPDKRARLIDVLLARGEFADYWGLKWGDLLRVKSEFPCNLWPNAVQAYDRWIRDAIRDGMPYDRFARALLTANGSDFRVAPVNFYRAFQERTPEAIGENVALVFMGLRLQDAGWTEAQRLGFCACFAQIGYKRTDEWKEEIVFFDPDRHLVVTNTSAAGLESAAIAGRQNGTAAARSNAPVGTVVAPALPGATPVRFAPGQDPRVVFADWLTAPDNPWFSRAIVNRVWFWLLGRGLVQEPDDMRPGNPPWSPELLAYLAQELVGHQYDLRHVYRLVLNSHTYQASPEPNAWNAGDTTGFSHYRLRRLDAEPLLDAINQVTGGTEKYVSAIPEPFTVLPNDQRAIDLADGSMESPFLELFGRPPRNTSFESERTTAPSVFQAQHLLNSSHIERKIERSTVLQQLAMNAPKQGPGSRLALIDIGKPANSNLVEDLYVRILSRFPSDVERRTAAVYLDAPKRKPGESVCDLVWALINSKEFLCRH